MVLGRIRIHYERPRRAVVELLDTKTDKPIPPRFLQQRGREQQSQRSGPGNSLTVRDALL